MTLLASVKKNIDCQRKYKPSVELDWSSAIDLKKDG